jgi:hypothetical protein
MDKTIEAVSNGMGNPVFAYLVVGIAAFAAFLILTGRLQFKGGKFILGDDTKFEKTNARFKALVENTAKMAESVSELTGTVNKLSRRVSTIDTKISSVEMSVLQLQLHDETLSIEERISAGQRYVDGGYNGATRVYCEKLLEEYKGSLKV